MYKLVLCAAVLFGVNAFAFDENVKVSCDVQTEADAQKCMEKQALAIEDHEEPNDGFATDRTDMLAGIMRVLDLKPEYVAKAKDADFAGAVVVHMDEHHIVYYTIKKGKNVSPEAILDLNTADLIYEWEDGSRIPPAKLFFLGSEIGLATDAYDIVVEQLEYAKEEQDERLQEE
jgi:hypothetical protein